jgi:hypothetical protein
MTSVVVVIQVEETCFLYQVLVDLAQCSSYVVVHCSSWLVGPHKTKPPPNLKFLCITNKRHASVLPKIRP